MYLKMAGIIKAMIVWCRAYGV